MMPEPLDQSDSPGTDPLPAGTRFAGRYCVSRLLHEGERKRTYLAADTNLGRRVSLAIFKTGEVAATLPEWEALAQVGGHDNIVTLYDRGRCGGTDYLVFEYLPRGTLRDYLARRGERGKPLAADEVKRLGRQLARALAHIHARGVIHRCISPANIWLDERGMAHLGDFGTAAVRRDAPHDGAVTADGYTAPELRAGEAGDERSDLYAMGAVLYEALILHRPPPAGETSVSRSLTQLRPEVPLRLRLLVSQLLEEAREQRPRSAEEVLHELRRTPDETLDELRRIPDSTHDEFRPASEELILGSDEAWISTLPFPLASILWLYLAEPDQTGKTDLALKFFEALAEFAVTILLSAGIANPEFFEMHKAEWFGKEGGRGPMRLNRGSMGAWTELAGRLAATGRGVLSGDSKEVARYLALFGASDTELIEALTAERLHKILVAATDRRNDQAHGGIVGPRQRRELLDDLSGLLTRTRTLLGWAFVPWTLLRPTTMSLSGDMFAVTATILTGTNAAFRQQQVSTCRALDRRHLYFRNCPDQTPLQLVPFFRLIEDRNTGGDACYFYSRIEPQGDNRVRWISYHNLSNPEQVISSPEVAEIVSVLHG